jgi:hypothetical protein
MAHRPQQNKASTKAHWIDNPRLLSLKDAAAYTGLTEWAMREAVWNGGLSYVKTHPNARKWWFRIEDLDRWIDRNTYTIN